MGLRRGPEFAESEMGESPRDAGNDAKMHTPAMTAIDKGAKVHIKSPSKQKNMASQPNAGNMLTNAWDRTRNNARKMLERCSRGRSGGNSWAPDGKFGRIRPTRWPNSAQIGLISATLGKNQPGLGQTG